MLSIGWIEMLMIGAIALIVVGPKDLPRMLQQLGKMVGSVRKMGNEFKAEINKATALDEVTDIRRSISQPFQTARQEIEREFNSTNKAGQTVPSGALQPGDPNAESVVDEIQAAIGKTPVGENSMFDPNNPATFKTPPEAAPKPVVKKPDPKKPAAKKPAAKKPAAKKPAAKKPVAKKPVTSKTAAAKKAPARTRATKASSTKHTTTRKPAAKKPVPASKPAAKTATTAEAKKASPPKKRAPRKKPTAATAEADK